MTAAITTGPEKPRSKSNRRLRNSGARASVTLFTIGICGLFILPLIYMVSAAFNDSGALSAANAPLYPSINRTYTCPDESICTYYDGYKDVNALTYNNAPVIAAAGVTVASTGANATSGADVSSIISKTRGLVSFGITTKSTTPLAFGSRESANKPQLVVTTCAPPADTTAPTPPTALTGSASSNKQIELSWTASTSSDVAGYRVYRDDTQIAVVGSTSWIDAPLASAKEYAYTVSAFDAAGNESKKTAALKVTTKPAPATAPARDTTAPTTPTGLKTTVNAWNSVSLSWAASTDNVAVISYNILRDAKVISKVAGTVTSFTDVTTAASATYAYTVQANDASTNTSQSSNSAAATTPGYTTCTSTTSTFIATADTYADQTKPDDALGDQNTLLVNGATGSVQNSYVKFDLTKLGVGEITAAELNLYSTTASTTGYTISAVSNTAWGEVKWVNTDLRNMTGQALPIYDVAGHGALAMLVSRNPSTGQMSIFIDPTNNKQYGTMDNVAGFSKVWDFHITLDNFSTASTWAETITAGQVTDNSLGGMLVGGGFARFFFNTLIIAGLGTIGATISAIIVAFGFARFRFPGRDALFLVLIGTILLPFQVVLIPQFIIFNAIGWTGTWLPLIVPHYFSNAYNVFLLRQYFLTLPRELDEAAMMDGASPIRILRSVIIPQSWPAIASVILFHFFFAWNDFLAPLIYLSGKPDLYPIAIGLNYFNTTFRVANAPAAIQAGALISLILPVLIFFMAQRVFMRGVVISGVEK